MDNVKPAGSRYRDWDRVKVGRDFFDLLIKDPVFQREPKAINTAQYWLREIDAAIERNDGKPVTWGYKDIEDRFRNYTQSHTVFRNALRDLDLIDFTSYTPPANDDAQGECRRFEILPAGRRLVMDANYQWLHNLLKDTQTRRRNQVAVSKRKATRKPYTDPFSRIIDEFRYVVKFERDGLLNQMQTDRTNAPGRFAAASHLLLAFETRKFCELEVKDGRIFNEFVALPREYRPFALFNGKPYIATLDIRACHPTFLGKYLEEFYQHCIREHLSDEPDQGVLAVATELNRDVNLPALKVECKRWTDMFTHPTIDPRDAIVREAHIPIEKADMKQCINTWLNGGKEYERRTDGKRNRTDTRRLEAWFQASFPEMTKVWAASKDRGMTGILIADAHELPLMSNPALYALGSDLGLTLSYEYDGVGVFAERGDVNLPAKLAKVATFIQSQSAGQFDVPVVVKAELLQ